MKNKRKNVVHNKIIPELVSGSSTPAVTQQQALKTLKKFQGLSYFTTTHAFTLIELLVVVLIIGILTVVAVPKYQVAVDKAEYTSVLPLLRAIANTEEMFYLENSRYGGYDEIDYPSFCAKKNASVISCQGVSSTFSNSSKMFDLHLPKSNVILQIYLKHSPNPGRIRCGGDPSSSRIERLCKALGAPDTYSTNSSGLKYWIIQGN